MLEFFDELTTNITLKEENDLKLIICFYKKIKEYDKFSDIYLELKYFLSKYFQVHNTKLVLFDKIKSQDLVLFHNGKEFKRNEPLTFSFEANLNKNKQIFYVFSADNTEHKEELDKFFLKFKILFCLIEPVIKATFLKQNLKELSFKDPMTGTYNRKFLISKMNKIIPKAKKEMKKIAFLSVKIDHFDAVIDEFDYAIGDDVLLELIKVLRYYTLKGDFVVKIASDTFLLVLEDISSKEKASQISLELIERFSECKVDVNSYTGQTLQKTICIGISMYPEDSTSLEQLLKSSGVALDEAKNKGRGELLQFSEIVQANEINFF